jgi:phosphohistidine phosphatase SixA
MANAAPPRLIILIRHAEKPDDKSDPHLSPAGRLRAAMLADQIPQLYPALSVIVAAAQSDNSNRCFETVEPLAKKLRLEIVTRFKDKHPEELAAALLDGSYAGKTILVCWHHEEMRDVAQDLRVGDAPKALKDDVFDRLWEILYGADGSASLVEKQQPPVPAA